MNVILVLEQINKVKKTYWLYQTCIKGYILFNYCDIFLYLLLRSENLLYLLLGFIFFYFSP